MDDSPRGEMPSEGISRAKRFSHFLFSLSKQPRSRKFYRFRKKVRFDTIESASTLFNHQWKKKLKAPRIDLFHRDQFKKILI